MAIVQKNVSHNRKLYVAFVDFEKAFDSVLRHLLWPILQKNNIKGQPLESRESMCNFVLARVKSGDQLSDLIQCNRGVKQDDVCIPVLFSLFVNELALDMIREGKHGSWV